MVEQPHHLKDGIRQIGSWSPKDRGVYAKIDLSCHHRSSMRSMCEINVWNYFRYFQFPISLKKIDQISTSLKKVLAKDFFGFNLTLGNLPQKTKLQNHSPNIQQNLLKIKRLHPPKFNSSPLKKWWERKMSFLLGASLFLGGVSC